MLSRLWVPQSVAGLGTFRISTPLPFAASSVQICSDLDIDTAPMLAAQGLLIAPLLSWYDAAYDARDPRCVIYLGGATLARSCTGLPKASQAKALHCLRGVKAG